MVKVARGHTSERNRPGIQIGVTSDFCSFHHFWAFAGIKQHGFCKGGMRQEKQEGSLEPISLSGAEVATPWGGRWGKWQTFAPKGQHRLMDIYTCPVL